MGAQARLLLVLVAAGLVAVAVWTWLPPTEASQDAMKQALVAYEDLNSLVWPDANRADATLPDAVEERLRREWEESVAAASEGDARVEMLRSDPFARSVAWRRRNPKEPFAVAAGGEVVYFDVRRRTLRGEILVRAAVLRWQDLGRWDEMRGEMTGVKRQSAAGCPILDYTLRQRGERWVVVGRSTPDEPPYFYDATTGQTGNGP